LLKYVSPKKRKNHAIKEKIVKTTTIEQSTYQIEAKFLSFIPKPGGELKYIQVQVGERIIPIKLAKELQETWKNKLLEGDLLSIFLEQKGSEIGSKLKLKTHHIEKIDTCNNESQLLKSIAVSSDSQPAKKQKGKILLCQKSSCSKRGGKNLYSALTETLEKLGLQDQVTIQLTGCQKQCKKAPSLILMPGKVKHTYVNPNDLTFLLKAHYLPN
jgi:NADH:ubiquinone oxidoreductase subunit E